MGTLRYKIAGIPYLVASSGAAVSLTGTTSETAMATVAIPAGAMGANGIIKVTSLWTYPSSANTKTLRIRLGGLAGTAYHGYVASTTLFHHTMDIIRNRNSQSSQVSGPLNNAASFTAGSASVATGSVDTSAAQDLVLSGQLSSAAETLVLEGYTVEVIYSA